MARRTAGNDGCGGGPGALDASFFSRLQNTVQTSVLQITKNHHGQQRVMVQSQPGSAFVMVQAKFILELADAPARTPSGP